MTNTDYEEFDFGGSYGAEVAKESNKGGDFQREIEFLKLDASPAGVAQGKDQTILRLATEYEKKAEFANFPPNRWTLPWITVKQHYAQTKQRPPYAKEGQTWPAKMYAVCRKDKVFAKKYGGTCLLDDLGNKPSDRTFALAVEREQVISNGQIVGIRDKTREVLRLRRRRPAGRRAVEGDKKYYAKKTVPAWVVLNMGYKNFFNALSGQAGYFGTILDADYVVKRTGTETDTNYTFVRLNPITMTGEWAQSLGVADGTPYHLGMVVAQEEGTGRPITLMERVYPDMPDLRKIVADRTNDEYYGRWFVQGWLPEGFDPTKASGNGVSQNGVQGGYQPMGQYHQQQQPAFSAPQQPAQPAVPQSPQSAPAGPGADALSALKARVTGQTQPAQDQQQQPQQEQNPWTGQPVAAQQQ
jgi:hypothetical protein